MNATVGKNGLLCLAFPAVTCYAGNFLVKLLKLALLILIAGSNYIQTQTLKLEDVSAGAIIVEWMTSGRVAMGESWDFDSFRTENEIWLGGELLIRDAVCHIRLNHFPFLI